MEKAQFGKIFEAKGIIILI